MADAAIPKTTANPLPEEIYPAHSTTSDMPTLSAALAAPVEPDEAADPPAVADPAEDAPVAGDPPADPEPPRSGRGRPSRADREIADLKARIEALTTTIETRLVPTAPPSPADPKPAATPPAIADEPRPKRADFDDPDAYEDAVDAWRDRGVERQLAARDAERAKAATDAAAETARKAVETETNQLISTWQERRAKAVEKYDDYADVAESSETPFTTPMLHAVLHSEFGPDIAYWLGENRKEAGRIAALNPISQALAIGRIEANFASGALSPSDADAAAAGDDSAADTPPAPQRSNAPRPIRPVTPRSAPVDEAPTEANSQSRIERHLAELRKGNQPLGWGTVPSGASRVN